MAEPDKRPVTMEELLLSSLAQTDAQAKLLIEKGLITQEELCRRFPRNGPCIERYLDQYNRREKFINKRKLQIFVSSTYEGLIDHRVRRNGSNSSIRLYTGGDGAI